MSRRGPHTLIPFLDLDGQARCTSHPDPDLWHPAGYSAPAIAQAERAKDECWACPVRPACLQWALEQREIWGVWGGLTQAERVELLRLPKPVDLDAP